METPLSDNSEQAKYVDPIWDPPMGICSHRPQ